MKVLKGGAAACTRGCAQGVGQQERARSKVAVRKGRGCCELRAKRRRARIGAAARSKLGGGTTDRGGGGQGSGAARKGRLRVRGEEAGGAARKGRGGCANGARRRHEHRSQNALCRICSDQLLPEANIIEVFNIYMFRNIPILQCANCVHFVIHAMGAIKG